jgi:hypothetical protein
VVCCGLLLCCPALLCRCRCQLPPKLQTSALCVQTSAFVCLQDDLARARQSFVMTTELHLTYLCVPITETVGLDWKRFENMLGTLQVRWGLPGWPDG